MNKSWEVADSIIKMNHKKNNKNYQLGLINKSNYLKEKNKISKSIEKCVIHYKK